jgi:hypothetical protein
MRGLEKNDNVDCVPIEWCGCLESVLTAQVYWTVYSVCTNSDHGLARSETPTSEKLLTQKNVLFVFSSPLHKQRKNQSENNGADSIHSKTAFSIASRRIHRLLTQVVPKLTATFHRSLVMASAAGAAGPSLQQRTAIDVIVIGPKFSCLFVVFVFSADTGAPEEGHGFDYDLIVLGGGSGGLACVKEAVLST